jgi:hypothetical protein
VLLFSENNYEVILIKLPKRSTHELRARDGMIESCKYIYVSNRSHIYRENGPDAAAGFHEKNTLLFHRVQLNG